ncbi:hypothetical protein Tco_1201263 [Tanacetum coccineum]
MNPVAAQQVALDNAMVALGKRLKIEKYNMRIEFNKPQRETTYQVTLDVLKHSPCYLAFLITAEVPEIYMHQFWNTIKKIKDTDAYRCIPGKSTEEETQDDEYVHTPEHYVPTDDETNDESDDVTEEEYERINEELYGDVNVSLTDAKPADKEKNDEDMTVASHVNINQEGASNHVNDDAQATQKTEVPIPSSSISSDYAAKYLNFDNIPPVDTEVVSMLDINVQHEFLFTTASSITISSLLSSLFLYLQQLTPIPTPTTTEATTSTTVVPDSETLSAFHQRITNSEKDVKELKTVDHSAALLSTIKSEVPYAIKEYLGTSLDDALYKVLKKHDVDIIKEHSVLAEIVERIRQHYVPEKSTKDIKKIKMEHAKKQQVPKETITSSDTTALEEFDQKTTLFETMTKSKSFKKSPSAGSDRGLKRRKTSKDTEPSKKTKLTETSKGTFKSQPKSSGKSAQTEETVTTKHDWFKKLERPLTPDSDWNVRKMIDFRPPQTWISKIAQAKKPPLSFDELMSTPIDFSTYNNPKGKECLFDLSKPLPLIMERCRQVVPVDYYINNDLEYLRGGSSSKKYTTSTTKTKAAKYDIPGIEVMVPSLWSPGKKLSNLERDVIFDLGVALRMSDISNSIPYTAYNNPQGIIYEDKYKRNRLMRTNELYKFSDGTLTSIRTVLHDIASNLRMDYLPKRRWSNLDRRRSCIMIKAIDKLL